MKRFCPKCGVTIESGTFCPDCIPKTLKYDPPLIQVSEFNRTWHLGTWHYFGDLDQVIVKRVQEALKRKVPITVEPFEFECRTKEKVDVYCNAIINDETVRLSVRLAYRQCDVCQKQKTQYFEGILQLRRPKPQVMELINRQMKNVMHKGIFITKTVDMPNGGVDLYFTNKNYLKIVAQNIHNTFGGIMKMNAQLFSHNHLRSKDLFRLNVYVELPNFDVGDVVQYEYTGTKRTKKSEQMVLINKLGRLTHAIDVTTGKTMTFELRFCTEVKTLKTHKTTIVAIQPEVQVLHPETYQAVTITNSLAKDLEEDDEVFAVFTNVGNYIVGYPNTDEDEE